ncbi:MAG: tetratricopeptide repeat protein [Reyranella sp.]
MRWLSLLIASIGIALSGTALALPAPDAEAAYARGDYATAFKIWLPLAEQGSPEAQRNVARMYERGEWVAQDKQAAAEWYSRAAEQSARDAALPGGAPVVASAGPVATPSTMPSSSTYPRPASYPTAYPSSSPSTVYVPIARPFFGFRFHGHGHHH